MYHIHLDNCLSTQTYLKDNIQKLLEKDLMLLVSTSKQTAGIGRQGKGWEQRKSSLAFSFNLPPNDIISSTSLEVGVLITKFLNENYSNEFFIKWPNDILNFSGKKIGGIICHNYKDKFIIVGVGLNFKSDLSHNYDYPSADIPNELSRADQKAVPFKLYQYVLDNRINTKGLNMQFNKLHFFHNKMVQISDTKITKTGKFVGINESGMALIEGKNGKLETALSGTLRPQKD